MAFLATLFFSKVDVYTCEGEQDCGQCTSGIGIGAVYAI